MSGPRWSARDRELMGEALALAARGAGRTSPNPMVGAVVADPKGRVVGRGFHPRAGEPHAEVLALREAGARARGATLYVTLEPCSHHGRTPPCAPAVAEAGVARLVAAIEDPDPRVKGEGLRLLAGRGVRVETGLLAREAARLNEAYLFSVREGRPFVTLKAAASLDGRIATRSGESRWITGTEARAFAHEQRDRVDAIVAGSGTVLADDPLLTARPEGREGKPLIRVVLDSRLRTPEGAQVLRPDRGVATIVATLEGAPREREEALRRAGAEVFRLEPDERGGVSAKALLAALHGRGVRHVLVEGGGQVHGAFLRGRLADQFLYFLAPLLIGDAQAPAAVSGADPARLADAPRLCEVECEAIGDDLLIRGWLRPPVWLDYGE